MEEAPMTQPHEAQTMIRGARTNQMALTWHGDVRQVGEALVAEVSFTAAEEDLRTLLGGHALLPERERQEMTSHTVTL